MYCFNYFFILISKWILFVSEWHFWNWSKMKVLEWEIRQILYAFTTVQTILVSTSGINATIFSIGESSDEDETS